MLDLEIIKYYNNVKDSSWPNIQSYAEYLTLPNFIKQECEKLHEFQRHKQLICDSTHWATITTRVCVYKNLAFVPIAKCAFRYYTTMFTDLGWELVNLNQLDVENTNFVGVVMHPLQRRLKGLTEWIMESYAMHAPVKSLNNPWGYEDMEIDWAQLKSDIKTKYFKKLVESVNIGDNHSQPYSVLFGNFLNKVNWIPMDVMSSDQVKISMMKFFHSHGHSIQLPLGDRHLGVSSSQKLELFNIVKSTCYNTSQQHLDFHKFYSEDLKFYYHLLDNFSPDWQQKK